MKVLLRDLMVRYSGVKTGYVKVEGFTDLDGVLAYAPVIDYNYQIKAWERSGYWNVVHVASGIALTKRLKRNLAKAVFVELINCNVDWSMLKEPMTNAMIRKYAPLIKKAVAIATEQINNETFESEK